jgi:sec-independent protein translocase protein TatA
MLEGWEWIIIGVVAIVIILWGPSKIPEFAKALGRAKGEFSKAQKDFTVAATANEQQHAQFVSAPASTGVPSVALKSKDEMLLDTAKKLGIPTEGKTRDQLSEEISIKVKLLGAE